MANFYKEHTAKLLSMYEKATILPEKYSEVKKAFEKFFNNFSRYRSVEVVTDVPPVLIFAIHLRESSASFLKCFHNGDPLPGPTKHVPANRGPFPSWEDSAIDALTLVGLSEVKKWNTAKILFYAEMYNGFGYAKRDLPSPYLWSFTDQYEKGKFASDGVFNPTLVDAQMGVVAILKAHEGLDVDKLVEGVDKAKGQNP